MAFYVYILQTEQDGTFYKGYTEQPLERLKQHNNQESSYTSSKVPWKLVGLLVFATKKEALIKEKKLKKVFFGKFGISDQFIAEPIERIP